jgi:hypothetical protein
MLRRLPLDRRGGQPLAAPGRPVGLGHDGEDGVLFEERAQGGEREGGGAVEKDAHG